MKTLLHSVSIQVYPDPQKVPKRYKFGALTAKKSSPFYDTKMPGVLLDNSSVFETVDIIKLIERETGCVISTYDLYYIFNFTVEIDDYSKIPDIQEKLQKFVAKHFTFYKK